VRKNPTWGWTGTRPNPISRRVWTGGRGFIPIWCWAWTRADPQTFNYNKNKNKNNYNTNNKIFNINTFNHNKNKNNYKTNNIIFIISNNIIVTMESGHLTLDLPLRHVALGLTLP